MCSGRGAGERSCVLTRCLSQKPGAQHGHCIERVVAMAQPRLVCAAPALPMQSEVAYEYFRDTFVLSTKSAYKKGQQVGRRTAHSLPLRL